MERDITELKLFQLYVDFNSHAHVERDCFHFFASSISNISTHTLTWSVTLVLRGKTTANDISTHTLTWSVTAQPIAQSYNHRISTHTLTWSVTKSAALGLATSHFNSHAHVERDRAPWGGRRSVCISTHTLTWSVTTPCGGYSLSLAFQLTRSRGA